MDKVRVVTGQPVAIEANVKGEPEIPNLLHLVSNTKTSNSTDELPLSSPKQMRWMRVLTP